jgi:hypothetical protein
VGLTKADALASVWTNFDSFIFITTSPLLNVTKLDLTLFFFFTGSLKASLTKPTLQSLLYTF